jgi:hypothetical protein
VFTGKTNSLVITRSGLGTSDHGESKPGSDLVPHITSLFHSSSSKMGLKKPSFETQELYMPVLGAAK